MITFINSDYLPIVMLIQKVSRQLPHPKSEMISGCGLNREVQRKN